MNKNEERKCSCTPLVSHFDVVLAPPHVPAGLELIRFTALYQIPPVWQRPQDEARHIPRQGPLRIYNQHPRLITALVPQQLQEVHVRARLSDLALCKKEEATCVMYF